MSTDARRMGRYQLQGRLGGGEERTEIYAALGDRGERVVIKTVAPSQRGNAELLERFVSEARIASILVHPNLLKVLEVGKEEGVPFAAMERVDGTTLADLLQRQLPGRTPPAIAAKVVAAVASALHHAQVVGTTPDGLQIVHRELGPRHLMVDVHGRVVLLDLGSAPSEPASTPTGVFAVGTLLLEMVGGAECPPRLAELIEWAIASDATHRCTSAGEWAAALEEFASRGPRPVGVAEVAAWAAALKPAPDPEPVAAAAPEPSMSAAAPSVPVAATAPGVESVASAVPQTLVEEVRIVVPRAGRSLAQDDEVTAPIPADDTLIRPVRRRVEDERKTAPISRLPPPRARPLRPTVLGLALIAALVGGGALSEWDPSSGLPPVAVAARPQASRSAFGEYLDAAEAAFQRQRYDAAHEDVELARQLGSTDPRENLRRVELASRIDREGGPVRVRALIASGDLASARTELRRLVEHDAEPAVVEKLAQELAAATTVAPAGPIAPVTAEPPSAGRTSAASAPRPKAPVFTAMNGPHQEE